LAITPLLPSGKSNCNFLYFFFVDSGFYRNFAPDFKGCCLLAAEMIPSKPDPGNAGVGMKKRICLLAIPFEK
jgi:hypothetical protein